MSLAPGSYVGIYEIVAPLGAGGMGEVYRARDSRLKRDVALKILTASFSTDSDRLARFQREAEVLASLTHPHIAAIHGIEESGASKALILELVDGDTLAERISRGAIPVDEALAIAKQIADALDTAHEHGIVHRDLKPANIKITPDGVVKVLDFGLAKLAEHATAPVGSAAASVSPTITSPALMTATGVILGTAAYMSPEQARGRAVDKRTDIWALGCILFEMLTGSRVFPGETVSDTIAAVLTAQPDYSALPPVSTRLRALLQRSLEKDPRRRWRDVADLRVDLESAGDVIVTDEPRSVASRIASRERVFWLSALLVTATALAAVTMRPPGAATGNGDTSQFGLVRFALEPAAGTSLYPGGWIVPFALSNDGRWIAYTASSEDGRSRLWLRAFDTDAAQPITGSEGATSPIWSPDSQWVGFQAKGILYRVRIPGGSPEIVTKIRGYTGGMLNGAWGKDAILFTGPAGNLVRVSPEGGEAVSATAFYAGAKERLHYHPQFLSNGRDFLYFARGTTDRLMRQLDGGAQTIVADMRANSTLQYASGYLLFVENNVLWAQRFDEDAGRLVGARQRIVAGVPVAGGPGVAPFSVSPTAVAYWTLPLIQQASELKWFDRSGNSTPAVAPRAVYDGFDLSRDGSRLVSAEVDGDGIGIWVQDLTTRGRFPLRLDPGGTVPVWAPDKRHIALMRGGALYSLDVDNTASGVVELTTVTRNQLAQAWTAAGDELIYENWNADNGIDLVTVNATTKRVTRLPWNTTANEFGARLSPDNRWLLYVTDQTGTAEVWVAQYPSGGGRRQLSAAGGTHPAWRDDGRELYFISADNQLTAMSFDASQSEVKTGPPTNLFRISGTIDVVAGSHNVYAPGPRGQRFLVSVKSELADVPPVRIILNWPRLLSLGD